LARCDDAATAAALVPRHVRAYGVGELPERELLPDDVRREVGLDVGAGMRGEGRGGCFFGWLRGGRRGRGVRERVHGAAARRQCANYRRTPLHSPDDHLANRPAAATRAPATRVPGVMFQKGGESERARAGVSGARRHRAPLRARKRALSVRCYSAMTLDYWRGTSDVE